MRTALFVGLAATLAFSQPRLDESKLVDLTHAFDKDSVYWPTEKPFEWHRGFWGVTKQGYWYASASFASSEHLGTHIDSPIHFGKDQPTTDMVPLKQLVGPAVVIDIREPCSRNRDYQLSRNDIETWEHKHARIPAGAIVFVWTGWSQYWPDRVKYLGSTKRGDTKNLHFPGIAPESAKLLVERKVDGVGIDTASLDAGTSKDFQSHQILNGAAIFGLENVANLDRLPPTGGTAIALPMKIRNGTGGPVRIVALLP